MGNSNGFKSAGLDAHKQFTRNQNKPVAAAHNITQELDIELDAEGQTKMHLVPCRWSRSGWKYVEVDPKDHTFFKNPNRVNSFGVTSPQKGRKGGSVARSTFQTSKSAFGQKPQAPESQTTYGRFFAS